MAHVNQQVREQAKEQLVSHGFGTVYTNDGPDLADAVFPAAVLTTRTDSVEVRSQDGLERRLITLTGVIVADGDSDTLDDDMDDLRALAEAALAGDLNEIAHSVEHTGGELDMGKEEEGERWYAFYTLTWQVEAWTRAGAPEVAL